jgi:hypothetical protein
VKLARLPVLPAKTPLFANLQSCHDARPPRCFCPRARCQAWTALF